MFTWNPVFQFVIDLKKRYEQKFGNVEYKKYTKDNKIGSKEISCLEYWAAILGDVEAINKLNYLKITQNQEFISIHYIDYGRFSEESLEISFDEIWDVYDGFYLECRGLVIDLKEESIVLSPFKKFRNINEGKENQEDLVAEEVKHAKSVEITNKLDGSMQSARWYQNRPFLAGSKSIDSEKSEQLKDGYRMLSANNNMIQMLKENPDETFIFEYISLADAHVVKYKKEEEGQYLIGIRNVYTGEQYSYKKVSEYAEKYGVPMTEVYNKSFNQILEEIKVLKSDEQEGFVVNIDGHMIKVKADDYVKIHRILAKASSINLIIECYAENKLEDLKSKVPEAYHTRIKAIESVIKEYKKKTEEVIQTYYENAPKEDLKEFMIWVDKNVPKEYRGYVRCKYRGMEYNILKSGSGKSTSYRKLKDMGVEDYNSLI